MQKNYTDIEKLLQEGNSISIKPRGYSMYPTFVPGRDEAVIEPVSGKKLRRGDVVLYRRRKEEGGILVLHRIQKADSKGIYLVGDNQSEVEGPLSKEQIKGIMAGMNRNGRYIAVTNPVYRLAAGIWLFLLPVRPLMFRIMTGVRKVLKNKKIMK